MESHIWGVKCFLSKLKLELLVKKCLFVIIVILHPICIKRILLMSALATILNRKEMSILLGKD